MKRKEVAALLAISITSVGLLTSCGVYGSAESYDDSYLEDSEYLNDNGNTEEITLPSEIDSTDVIDDFVPAQDMPINVYGPAPESN